MLPGRHDEADDLLVEEVQLMLDHELVLREILNPDLEGKGPKSFETRHPRNGKRFFCVVIPPKGPLKFTRCWMVPEHLSRAVHAMSFHNHPAGSGTRMVCKYMRDMDSLKKHDPDDWNMIATLVHESRSLFERIWLGKPSPAPCRKRPARPADQTSP